MLLRRKPIVFIGFAAEVNYAALLQLNGKRRV